ncbi:MAG: hypothetical protein Q7T54_03640 [Candidatus Levybacteria bacterium]|nr:hypothetical protein [Candidatus Levybacteria bacterium]
MNKVSRIMFEIISFVIAWGILTVIIMQISQLLNISPIRLSTDECWNLDPSFNAIKCSQEAEQSRFYGKIFVSISMIIGSILIFIFNRIYFHKAILNKKIFTRIYKEAGILILVVVLSFMATAIDFLHF